MTAGSASHIVVLGAGVIGSATALALANHGFRVTLLDRDEPGEGCSFGNAGLIADDHILPLARTSTLRQLPGMLTKPDAPLRLAPTGLLRMLPWMVNFALACRPSVVEEGLRSLSPLLAMARPSWQRLITEAGLADLFHAPGALYVFETEAANQAARAEEQLLAEHGIETEAWTPEQVRAELPDLAVPVAGGRFYPRMMSLRDPKAITSRIVDRLRTLGGEVVRAEVRAVTIGSDGRPVIRLTSGNTLQSDQLVVAAGAASGDIMAGLGHPIPVTGERGYHVMLDTTGDNSQTASLVTRSVTFMERGFVATPMDGGLRLAGTVELGASGPNWGRADVLNRHIKALFPKVATTEISRWSGERPTTPDYRPVIGRIARNSPIIAAFGHQHLGLTLAAATAELVAGIASHADPVIPLEGFRATRF